MPSAGLFVGTKGDIFKNSHIGLTAALTTYTEYTTAFAGLYRINYYLEQSVAAVTSASATVTLGWTSVVGAMTVAGAALTSNATTANQSGSFVVNCTSGSNITSALAYASNGANVATFNLYILIEVLA